VAGIVVDGLLRDTHRHGGPERFAGTEIAPEAWVGATRDLHADPVPGEESLCGRPQPDTHFPDAVGRRRPAARR